MIKDPVFGGLDRVERPVDVLRRLFKRLEILQDNERRPEENT